MSFLPDQFGTVVLLINAAAVAAAALIDLYTRKIPNVFIIIMLACSVVHAAMNPAHAFDHFLCGLYVAMVGVILYQRKAVGGGDVKMIAVLATWFVPQQLMMFILWVLICGGVLSVIYLAMIAARLSAERFAPQIRLPAVDPKGGMAYGVATACGYFFCAWKVLL